MATSTPWGPSHQSKSYARGIVSYSTSTHGGIKLSRGRIESLPQSRQALIKSFITKSGDAWFEEDSDWSIAACLFPEFFDEEQKSAAERTLRNNHPEIWEGVYGRPLAVEESRTLREKAFHERHQDDYIAISAWGSWAKNVPDGKVGVCATLVRDIANFGRPATYWLVDKEDYDVKTEFGFLIDPKRHQQVDYRFG